MRNFSLHFNARNRVWIAKYRCFGGGAWKTKWLPKSIHQHQAIEAELWFMTWYLKLLETGASRPANEIRTVKTAKVLVPIWLRERDQRKTGSSQNYHRLLTNAANCWILDNPKHPHLSIESLDLERDFSVELIRQWLRSIPLSPGTVLGIVGVLRNFFRDLIAEGTLDAAMVNPLDTKPVVRELKELRALRDRKRSRDGRRIVTAQTAEEASTLCTAKHAKVPPGRQVRYAFALATAARDNEIQALTWNDLDLDAAVPCVKITKQLLKPGIKPPLWFESERAAGRSRKEILSSPHAVLCEPKYGRGRTVPLHPTIVTRLRRWRDLGWKLHVGSKPRSDDPLFPRDRKSPVPGIFAHSQSAPLLRQDLRHLGLPTDVHGRPLVFHSLRHTTASLLKAAGVPLDDVGELLGHANGSVTRQHYVDSQLSTLYGHVCKLPLHFDAASAELAERSA